MKGHKSHSGHKGHHTPKHHGEMHKDGHHEGRRGHPHVHGKPRSNLARHGHEHESKGHK